MIQIYLQFSWFSINILSSSLHLIMCLSNMVSSSFFLSKFSLRLCMWLISCGSEALGKKRGKCNQLTNSKASMSSQCNIVFIQWILINMTQPYCGHQQLTQYNPHQKNPYLHWMWFLLALAIKPTPSRTLVMSYMRLFCTFKVSAASFRSKTPSGEAWRRSQNFLVKVPRDVSGLRSVPFENKIRNSLEGGEGRLAYGRLPCWPRRVFFSLSRRMGPFLTVFWP